MESAAGAPTVQVSWAAWVFFSGLVVLLLTLDLVVFHRRIHTPSLKESVGWSAFWIGLALLFNLYIWWWRGPRAGAEYLTGYLIEKSLSMDNIFVFAVIFRFFRVELKYQYRVLFWGILGAIVMRLLFILIGAELVRRFDWTIPIFGAFLVYTAVKLATSHDRQVDPEKNLLLRLSRRYLRVAHGSYGPRFFVQENGRLCITSLFLVLVVIESTDVLFAVDSVPAIFGVTKDVFIIFTSNIFAILGLRALYFLLASVVDLFCYLVYGLTAVLGFVGLKMIAEHFVPHVAEHLIPIWLSLTVVGSLVAISIIASIIANRLGAGCKPQAADPVPALQGEPGPQDRP